MAGEHDSHHPGGLERTISGSERDPDVERADELAEEVAAENEDEVTSREAIEQELAAEHLSEEGGRIGEHID
jgi:hypothetical protein